MLSGYEYRCSGGETFDSIALELYGDEWYAADLLTANPAQGEKLYFLGGEVLVLPVIDAAEIDRKTGQPIGKAPWRD